MTEPTHRLSLTHFADLYFEHDGLSINLTDRLLNEPSGVTCDHPGCDTPCCCIAWVREGGQRATPIILCNAHFSKAGITAAFRGRQKPSLIKPSPLRPAQ